MLANADCTVYDSNTLERRTILGVHWEDCEGTVRRRTGAQAQDSTVVLIPFSSTNTPPKKGDYLVKGITDYRPGRASDLLKALDVRTVLSVDTVDYGSVRMRHWEVAAK